MVCGAASAVRGAVWGADRISRVGNAVLPARECHRGDGGEWERLDPTTRGEPRLSATVGRVDSGGVSGAERVDASNVYSSRFRVGADGNGALQPKLVELQ